MELLILYFLHRVDNDPVAVVFLPMKEGKSYSYCIYIMLT